MRAAPLQVTRDTGRDFRDEGEERQRGPFASERHDGEDLPREAVADVGVGCLACRTREGHRALMRLPRWRTSHTHRFTTPLPGAEEPGS